MASTLLTSLISYYKLDENAANTHVDDAQEANDGTASTNTSNLYNANGKINSAFDFATAENVDLSTTTSLLFSTEVTVAAWFKTTGEGWAINKKVTSGGHYNYLLRVDGSKADFFNDRTAGTRNVKGTTDVDDGDWHFLVGRGDSAGMNIYVDGVLEAHTANTNAFITPTATYSAELASSYAGLLDEVGIWGKALTDGGVSVGNTATGEIAELYNSGSGLAYPFTTESSSPSASTSPSSSSSL